MALPSFCRETVTVLRAPLVASRGTSERDWAAAVAHSVAGCSVQLGSATLDRSETREATTTTGTLYAPPGADIRAADRVECSCGTFSVEGEPMPRVSPTGAASHTECRLARWGG